MASDVIRAAGAVVWRAGADGAVEVLLIHRPKYDDWSLPKGKREAGETDEQCAVREVEEETGVRGRLGFELLPCRYDDRKGRPKVVRYWAMEAGKGKAGGRFVANDEVDQLLWCSLADAVSLLSYDHDVDVLLSFESRMPVALTA